MINNNLLEHSKEIYKDKRGKILIIDILYRNKTYRIINFHGENNERERLFQLKEIVKWINDNTIIVGDFNIVLNKIDLSSNNIFRNDTSRTQLLKIMQEHNLVDLWRINNTNSTHFSRKQTVLGKLKQSRIDLLLAAKNTIQEINNIQYKPNVWSDHDILQWEQGIDNKTRGAGTWCLNSSILNDKALIYKIKNLLENIKAETVEKENITDSWDDIKNRIKKTCINYSKRKKWFETREEIKLKKFLADETILLNTDIHRSCEQYEIYKEQLRNIEIKKCKGAIIRSKVKYTTEGEKCTSFFLGLEKKKQNKSYINQLTDNKGQTLFETDEILDHTYQFYKQLFSKQKDLKEKEIPEYIKCINKKLERQDKDWCDSEITEEEIKNAIQALNKNKSPGSDGLTAEFYVKFQEELTPLLNKLYRDMLDNKRVPATLTEGIISLIFKKGDNKLIKNYRPISLLNTDYKILTKILANRLKQVSGSIINSTQSYSIPGRDISDSILTIKETIHNMQKDKGFLLSIDLEKAFDRVDHTFLFNILQAFGFGSKFINWIKLLYNNAKSCIKVNGFLTEFFTINRSVRQGCPLSALLYSIVAEPLALHILQDKDIKGIPTGYNRTTKITQYADDINIMVLDSHSIDKVLKHIHDYEKVAGAKMNLEKSEIMFCGSNVDSVNKWNFAEVNKPKRILGVYVGKNENEATRTNWEIVITKTKNILNLWKARGLTLKGRVIVTNALVLSKINHIMGVCELPHWALNSLNSVISSFLWRGKGNLIAHRVLIANKREGV
ncbi:pol-like protein [Xyrichtys novacula]|uniref:Pol-like protein n=1 Tax=Xyrichtys novacula TaxID=13765 RepID=A0AAV1H0X9_XYRNO|nr:pol-like protein [Xyrichtys novacula]